MNPLIPTEDELHAYVDGQLDVARRAQVQAWLDDHPEMAAEVAAWRRQAETLRTALPTYLLPTNAALDPVAVRRTVRRRRQRRLALCASLVIAIGVGGLGGWQARDMSMAAAHPPMQDALEAYRTFATDRLRPVEMDASHASDLETWLSARVGRPMSLPDLQGYGFKLLGGRLLSTSDGAAALVMYEDSQGQRMTLYVRPSTRFPGNLSGSRQDNGLLAKYWFRNGYGFAVVGLANDPRTAQVQAAMPAAT
ncbi:anti-sigma factor [Dyella sp.]|uniref:anti-sigma factor family protein n=1 Tax=Dyella sp. TaxID=1869338 RepID=UPI002ED23F27